MTGGVLSVLPAAEGGELQACQAWVMAVTGRTEEAAALLSELRRGVLPARSASWAGGGAWLVGQPGCAIDLLTTARGALADPVEPAIGMHLHLARGGLEMDRGPYADAIAAFGTAGRLVETLVTPHSLTMPMRAHMLQTLVMLGQTGRVERALADMDAREREGGEMRNVTAVLRLAQHDLQGAPDVLAPVLDGSVPVHPVWMVGAALIEAIASDALGDWGAAEGALERALDLAESDLMLFPFLVHRAPGLLQRHARGLRQARGADR